MRKITIFLMLPFILSGCISLTQERRDLKATPTKEVKLKEIETQSEQKQPLQFKKYSGFFLKHTVKLPDDINFFTVSSVNRFKSFLGITKAMSATFVAPNFGRSVLLIIAEKPSIMPHDITVNQIYMKENNMYVEYEIKEHESNKGYFVQNLCVFEAEKPSVILNVYFVNKDNNAFVIPFGNRHDKSPLDVLDMLEKYTGTYKGIFPAADNNKILTELNLRSDYSYTLRQEYLTAYGKVFESSGKWYPSVDISSFVLNKNKDLIFYFINKNTIEKLSNTGERLESGDYILKK